MKKWSKLVPWLLMIPLNAVLLGACTSKAGSTPTILPTSTESELVLPLVSPSAEEGQAAYANYCASCHGDVVINPEATHPLTVDEINQATPQQLFALLSSGALDKGMPAFSDLSSNDRWDIVAFLTASTTTLEDQKGAALIYQNMCTSCHGSNGSGNGPQALQNNLQLSNWQSEPLLSQYSNQQLYDAIASNQNHLMANFSEMLDSNQIWGLAAYSRAISVSSSANLPITPAGVVQTVNHPDLSQSQGVFTIYGQILNASGGTLDGISSVKLLIEENGQEDLELNGAAGVDGSYTFAQVPYAFAWTYVVQAQFDQVLYKSNRVYGQNITAGAEIPINIKVYDSVSDTSLLRAESMHVMLDFEKSHLIHVTESILVTNPSTYAVSTQNSADAVLRIPINAKASGFSFNNFSGTEYLKVANGYLYDFQPILPGSVHQVLFEYDLPFDEEQTIELEAPLQVVSAMVMVENQGDNVKCSGMTLADQYLAKQESLLSFTAHNVKPNEKLKLHCYNSKEVFPIVIGAGVLLVVLLIVILWGRQKRKKEKLLKSTGRLKTNNPILDAIITLDDQYKAGEIPSEVYHAKREELVKKISGE